MKSHVGLTRIHSDKFYTKSETVDICLKLLPSIINPKKDIIIEPSAGNGSFSEPLKKLFKNVIAMDIEPERESITKADFLNFDFKSITNPKHKIHCVGNPPFGRQSSLARKFIKYAVNFCDTISFILPKSFKKESYKKAFPLNFYLITEIDIADDSYTINGKNYSVPCVFQVWEKKEDYRIIPVKKIPSLYKYVKKGDNPDFSIRRVGFYAGSITDIWEDKNIQSHYFIKLINCDKQKFMEMYSNVKFTFGNTVGPKSISKDEIDSQL